MRERRDAPSPTAWQTARERRRILDAGAGAFRRYGYAGVTVKDIAALAGLRATELYRHFDSKEEIVEEILERAVEEVFAATRAAVAALGREADPAERLRAAISAHLRVVLAEGDYAVADVRIVHQVPPDIRARHRKRQRRYGAFWRTLFRDAADVRTLRRDLDLSVVRMLTLGALHGTVEWYDTKGRQTPARIASHLSAMILEGLAPRRNGR